MRTGVGAGCGAGEGPCEGNVAGSTRAAGSWAASRSVSDDSGSCMMGAAGAGLAPKSNLLTGALVATGAGLSMPGMLIAPVTGARDGAAPLANAAGRGCSMPGMRTGTGAADAG